MSLHTKCLLVCLGGPLDGLTEASPEYPPLQVTLRGEECHYPYHTYFFSETRVTEAARIEHLYRWGYSTCSPPPKLPGDEGDQA